MTTRSWIRPSAVLLFSLVLAVGCDDDDGGDGAGGAGGGGVDAAGMGGAGGMGGGAGGMGGGAGGMGGGAGGMGGGAGGMGGGGGDQTCATYCDQIETNCAGTYPDRATCMNTCAQFPADGEPGALSGNSLQCRIYHGGVPASMDAALHCPHAAGEGGDVCGGFCEVYCDLMETNCAGTYADRVGCMASCAEIPTAGAVGAVDGNSIQCRIYHAGFPAAGDGALHCPHAAAEGGGVCGSYCDNYCDLMDKNCAGTYADRDACMSSCSVLRTDGDVGAVSGNSLQCRIYHGSFPAAGDGVLHCPHAAAEGGGVCGSLCENYCDQLEAQCDGGEYPDRDACINTCATFPADGDVGAVAGDSVQCRIYHSSFPAADDAALHCPHAGSAGGNVCGSYCEVYCGLVAANCTGADAVYANDDECMAACAGFPTDAPSGAVAGDSVQCRIYHAGVPASIDPGVHCPHTAPDGGGLCAN